MVVAQLVEQLFPSPEICGLNPKIVSTNGKFNIENAKIKKKPGMTIH